MITIPTTPSVPLPAGARWDGCWQPDEPHPYRIITTADRRIKGHPLTLWATANQFTDGSIDTDREPPTVNLTVDWEDGLSVNQARQLAALILEAADEIERWPDSEPDDAGAAMNALTTVPTPELCQAMRVLLDEMVRCVGRDEAARPAHVGSIDDVYEMVAQAEAMDGAVTAAGDTPGGGRIDRAEQ